MRVMSNCNSHAQQRQQESCHGHGFAECYASMAASHFHADGNQYCKTDSGHCIPKPDLQGFRLHTHGMSHHGMQWHGNVCNARPKIIVVESCHCDCVKIGHLKLQKEENTATLVESKPFVAEPKYPNSIWDLTSSEVETELANAWAACSHLETEGLSKGEIYNLIESIYKDYLGADFETQWNLYSPSMNGGPGSKGHGFFLAQSQFESQLIKFDVGRGNVEVIREARGYSGMSETGMRAAVREKYPENMTLKDCLLMAEEMWKLGLTEGNAGYCVKNYLHTSLGVNWSPPVYSYRSETDIKEFNNAFEKLYSAMLDMPVDFEDIEALHNEYTEKGGFDFVLAESTDELLEKLLACLGGSEMFSEEVLDKILALLKAMEESGGFAFN